MCRKYAGLFSSRGILCEAADLVVECPTCGMSGLRWGDGLVV